MAQLSNRVVILGGAAGMLLAMGVGRFGFTAILPMMQQATGFGDVAAGAMASLNLVGYLLGALAAGKISRTARPFLYRAAIVLSTLCVGLMALDLAVWGWILVRFAAGVASGLVFIAAAGFVLEHMHATGRGGSALHFIGVGAGIAFSGLVTVWEPDWSRAWLILALMSAVMSFPAWRLGGLPAHPLPQRPSGPAAHSDRRAMRLLILSYALEGFGYIITGTFLVSLLRRLPETADLGPVAWIVAGLCAAPSPFLCSWAARRYGPWRALTAIYLLQSVGVAVALLGDLTSALISAALFGGTFIGSVGVSLSLGAQLRPDRPGPTAALLTVLYGIGQAIGPAFAGWAAAATGSFTLPILVAAGVIAAAAVLSWVGHLTHR